MIASPKVESALPRHSLSDTVFDSKQNPARQLTWWSRYSLFARQTLLLRGDTPQGCCMRTRRSFLKIALCRILTGTATVIYCGSGSREFDGSFASIQKFFPDSVGEPSNPDLLRRSRISNILLPIQAAENYYVRPLTCYSPSFPVQPGHDLIGHRNPCDAPKRQFFRGTTKNRISP